MKKHFLLILIFTLICGINYSQHLIRVNNHAGVDADYTTLQDANDNASNGDTIYVEGSSTRYAGADISKKLTIIGPGYFLSENDSTQANGPEAKFIGNINFNSGSDGSIITGCNLGAYDIFIYVDEINVVRCKVDAIRVNNAAVNNILLLKNYVNQINTGTGGVITNSVISNNIVSSLISCSVNSGPMQITNNVVFGTYSLPITCYNSSIANNIICNSNYDISVNTGNTIINNLLGCDGTAASGNQYNVVMANVFVDYDGSQGYSTDGKWQLKPGSPAIGAGISGVDCGAFGGISSYVLSGLPALPHIYEAAIPGTANSDEGLSCTIKVKSGK